MVLAAWIVLFTACREVKKSIRPVEDFRAKELLQGIWLNDESDTPLMYVKGDTVYYADQQGIPRFFQIMGDTLYTYGNDTSHYKIDRQTEYSFWFHTFSDNVIKLHKSEEPNDTVAFVENPPQIVPSYTVEVMQKDSVVMYNGKRYRAYVYINPSTIKVLKTVYSEEGIGMDNVYYDNIMHICIYEGRKKVYASNITKQMFSRILPEDFLQQSILSDMNFIKVDSEGFHYQTLVCIPESSVYSSVKVTVTFDNKLIIKTGK